MLIRRFLHLLMATLVLLGGVGYSEATSQEQTKNTIDQILDHSGWTDMLNAFSGMIDQQVATQVGNLEAST